MADLKIRVFKGDEQEPTKTVNISSSILRIASNLIPKRAVAALEDEGIDIKEIVKLSENPDAVGQLVEIHDHEKNERVVISLE